MGDSRVVSVNYGPAMRDLMESVMRTIVQQPDFRGIGGHGLEVQGGHGLHSQVSIGIGDATVNFRELQA